MFRPISRQRRNETSEKRLAGTDAPNSMLHTGSGSAETPVPGVLGLFEELYRVHGGRMKSTAYQLLRSTADAEDAVQEAFLKAFRSMGSFHGGASFSTWCYRVLINTCHDMLRRNRSRRRSPGESAPGEFALRDARTPPGDHALRMTLERSVAELPQRLRVVFVLFEVEGFRHREIAEILEIPEATSRTLLFEAKKALQQAMWRAAV
jgi:RNA polymerase sigma-70 factor, ECF subfamily